MNEKSSLEQNTSRGNKTSRWGQRLLWGALVVVLMASSSYATYAWQQRKIAQLGGTISASKDKITFLSEQQSALTKELSSLSAQNSELVQLAPNETEVRDIISKPIEPSTPEKPAVETLKFEILGYRKHPERYKGVIVDLSITNPSKEALPLVLSDFILNSPFSKSANVGESGGQTMPNGFVVFKAQVVAPGETVKGAMIFSVLGEPSGMQTLEYKGQTDVFYF